MELNHKPQEAAEAQISAHLGPLSKRRSLQLSATRRREIWHRPGICNALSHIINDTTVPEMHQSGDPAVSLFLKVDLSVFCDVPKQLVARRILKVFLSISCLAEYNRHQLFYFLWLWRETSWLRQLIQKALHWRLIDSSECETMTNHGREHGSKLGQ